MLNLHATCVAVGETGVLLRGPSGGGKSDLALRLIDEGARLVADDRTVVALADGRLVASAPEAIAGRMEVRGIGVVPVATAASVPVGLVVDLVGPQEVERMPESATCEILELPLPLVRLDPFEPSAAAKVRLAVRAVRQGIMPPP